jgi:sec-independent protein translocase protein TatA
MGLGKIDIVLIIVLIIILLLVGGKKLPELAKGAGEAARELKKGFNGEDDKKDSKSSKKDTKK